MSKLEFTRVAYMGSAHIPSQIEPVFKQGQSWDAEIAVVGRSNVGKSSMLNCLFRKKGLARTSSKPGKTQAIHLFDIDDSICLIDLPGYGYAKVAKKLQADWEALMEAYFESERSPKAVLFLLDIRRVPNADDMLVVEWAKTTGRKLIPVLTKVDKLNQSQKHKNTLAILEALDWEGLNPVHFSSKSGRGRDQLIRRITEEVYGPVGADING